MSPRDPRRWPLDRRSFLRAMAAAAGSLATLPASSLLAQPARSRAGLGMPGPYPGRVIEIQHSAAVLAGEPSRHAVHQMIRRGISELTGVQEPVEAWRTIVSPGEVIGIKVNPVGHPYAISNIATVHALVDELAAAGVRRREIVLFDRYRDQLIQAGYRDNLPAGCRWEAAADRYDEAQLDIQGYDPDAFVSLPIVHASPGVHDPRDDRTRRSHLVTFVTRTVDKLINIPVLKDHSASGVTLALKNMSHGLVNNVSRSHGTHDSNTCNVFIPAICDHPILRTKAVLHILDGLNAVYQGGPSARPRFVWQHGALFFATDPVAMDQIGWGIVDARRQQASLPPVAQTGQQAQDPLGTEWFDHRQPQHIAGAAALGLGEADLNRIDHRIIRLP